MWKKIKRIDFIALRLLNSTYYVWLFEKITKQLYYSINIAQEN